MRPKKHRAHTTVWLEIIFSIDKITSIVKCTIVNQRFLCACVYVTERASLNSASPNSANICECVRLRAFVHVRVRVEVIGDLAGDGPLKVTKREAVASLKTEKWNNSACLPPKNKKDAKGGDWVDSENCDSRVVCPSASHEAVKVGTGLRPRPKQNNTKKGLGPTRGNSEGRGMCPHPTTGTVDGSDGAAAAFKIYEICSTGCGPDPILMSAVGCNADKDDDDDDDGDDHGDEFTVTIEVIIIFIVVAIDDEFLAGKPFKLAWHISKWIVLGTIKFLCLIIF